MVIWMTMNNADMLNDVDEMTKGGCDYHLGAGEAKFIHLTNLRAECYRNIKSTVLYSSRQA